MTSMAVPPSCSCLARNWSDALDVDRTLILLGPTGIGKTAVALALAEHWPIEVVSADSRQVYRGLDIATAKPTPPMTEHERSALEGLDPTGEFAAEIRG